MPTIQDIEQEIIQEFSAFEDWMEKYEYIIELGKVHYRLCAVMPRAHRNT